MNDTLVVPSKATLLAYGITEWTTAMQHLEAMVRAGVFVPINVRSTLATERRILLWRWDNLHHRSRSIGTQATAEIVAEARTHLTSHLAEVDLIERKVNS